MSTVVESVEFLFRWKLELAGTEVEAALLERHETSSGKETRSKTNINNNCVVLSKRKQEVVSLHCYSEN